MLSERQLFVLQVIIDEFIQTAQPIGSRAISKKEEISYSSATIRNEMADLEDMGFIEKTHSSSGRVPSEKGYRFYVDHLVSPFRLSTEDLVTIQDTFEREMLEFERVVQKSATVLSDLTNYTSIILGPEVFETKLKQLQIIPLTPQTAVAILVTNTGHVEHRSFSVPVELDASDLEKMVNILNDRLHGVPLVELHDKLLTEITYLIRTYTKDFEASFQYLRAALFDEQPVKLYFGGKTNILMQPEFKDVNKIRTLYSMIEEEEEMARLIRTNSDGLKVTIGQENKSVAMQDCSLITATYSLGDKQMGTIALLGPTRMEYSRVITLLNVLSGQLSKTFQSWYQNG
ncbi:heat-inducible transcriptional repressor HrcA [Aquibacillus sp. 3ASR75-11]|uniref:Heat-inducible transcription repressor HrcA n=1 Tax=Terrihalobacillus insolitus TaxID=2950438 RepID=A0A9X4AM52_9BACI|nr:heat-inducible transcriptional repressor HrcA [Terrihalobacillus insolitus]MDC3413333.1 heat-inducible transcriptional repressor HrcA [Terrihalobacillus insolitus]MDC3424916.1 heat-inducible transcriptional repressor HrcA [Terrihalobacillus insolitus]